MKTLLKLVTTVSSILVEKYSQAVSLMKTSITTKQVSTTSLNSLNTDLVEQPTWPVPTLGED